MRMPVDLRGRDLLALSDLTAAELREVLDLAGRIKRGDWREKPLVGKHVCLLFQRPSHRTRVSFEVGVTRLGGSVTMLNEADVQLGHREPVADAAHVLDSYVDGIVARMRTHADLEELAAAATRPVINALTDLGHPCQALADLQTLIEVDPSLEGKVVFVGDGNNVASSLIEGAAVLGFPLTIITPPGREPDASILAWASAHAAEEMGPVVTTDLSAVRGATAVYTDVWVSMGQEEERAQRLVEFCEYQVDEALMELAPGAVFMHCLPAHRGEEVTAGVIDGPRSIVFQQAANRLYAQMALMALVMA